MIAWEAAAGPTAPPVRASEARPLGNRRRSLLRRAIATSRANATSIVCRDFRPNHTEQRAIAAPRAFNGLCDDEGVPLICPTCQVLPPKASLPAPACYFAWGCFRYFCWEPQRRSAAARILLEAAPLPRRTRATHRKPDARKQIAAGRR